MEAVLFQIVRALATVFEITLAQIRQQMAAAPQLYPAACGGVFQQRAAHSDQCKNSSGNPARISRLPVGFPRPVEHQGFL